MVSRARKLLVILTLTVLAWSVLTWLGFMWWLILT